jgi:hypothetical protein
VTLPGQLLEQRGAVVGRHLLEHGGRVGVGERVQQVLLGVEREVLEHLGGALAIEQAERDRLLLVGEPIDGLGDVGDLAVRRRRFRTSKRRSAICRASSSLSAAIGSMSDPSAVPPEEGDPPGSGSSLVLGIMALLSLGPNPGALSRAVILPRPRARSGPTPFPAARPGRTHLSPGPGRRSTLGLRSPALSQVLIVYATYQGHTLRVAQRVADAVSAAPATR